MVCSVPRRHASAWLRRSSVIEVAKRAETQKSIHDEGIAQIPEQGRMLACTMHALMLHW